MKRIFIICAFFILFLFNVSAQGYPVCQWTLNAMGENKHQLTNINGEATALLYVVGDNIFFSICDNTLSNKLGPDMKIANISLANEKENGYLVMRGAVSVIGQNKTGILTMYISESDNGTDWMFFNFYTDTLYLVGRIPNETYFERLSNLATLGSVLESGGGKLRGTLESTLKSMMNR